MFAGLIVRHPETQGLGQKTKSLGCLLASYIGVLPASARLLLHTYVTESNFALPLEDKSIAF
jgi:hypothetical protein